MVGGGGGGAGAGGGGSGAVGSGGGGSGGGGSGAGGVGPGGGSGGWAGCAQALGQANPSAAAIASALARQAVVDFQLCLLPMGATYHSAVQAVSSPGVGSWRRELAWGGARCSRRQSR